MATQIGLMQLKGTVGNMTFYATKDGNFARQKAASRPITSERTQENMSEFSRTASAGKLVRRAFAAIITNIKDRKLTKRLSSRMHEVLAADLFSERGKRNVADGDIELLEGFELNADSALNTVLKTPYVTTIDRETGDMSVTIPALNPSQMIVRAEGATHYKFTIAGAMINFNTGDHLTAMAESDLLLLANVTNPEVVLDLQVPVFDGNNALILALGVSYFQQMNDRYYAVGEKLQNALAFVDAANPAA